MKKKALHLILFRIFLTVFLTSAFVACDKDVPGDGVNVAPYYNLDITLFPVTSKMAFGENGVGFIKFRQDPDTARIITLDTRVFHLQPNHAYQLQRAVDPISSSSCTSTVWLTLGKGLVAQTIQTDNNGNGQEDLFRNVTATARGTQFRIHFQIVDAVTMATVLTSDCFQYTVR